MKEIFKDIPGYNGKYKISNKGNIKSSNYGKKDKTFLMKKHVSDGYYRIGLYRNGKRKQFAVHRLVAQSFLGFDINNSNLCVCHKDDNRKNNLISNLFIGNNNTNINDKVRKGRQSRGEMHQNSKFTKKDIYYIRSSNKMRKDIAAEFGVSPTAISQIVLRKTWKHI